MRAVHDAIFDKHIAATTGNFAANRDPGVTVLHAAAPDDQIFRRHAHAATVVVSPRFDRDAIVAGRKGTVLDQHIATGFRIAAVVVRSVGSNGYPAHDHVG